MALASYFDPSNRGARLARKNMHSAQPEGASEYSRGETASRYTKKRKSRGRHKVLRNIFIIIAIVLVSGVGAAWAYINNINSRLSEGVDSELRESLTETQSGEPFYMLLLGIDKNEKRVNGSYGADDSAYRSDSIMLARIDPTAKKVTLVSIPRDTYVDMGVNGQEKINAAYSFGGAAYATKVISDFAGVPISHYAEVDMDGMAAVVDAVGGIDVMYKLAPLLNAPGRMERPDPALKLLLCENKGEAGKLLDELKDWNARRKQKEAEITEMAMDQVKALYGDTIPTVIVVAGENWHVGVIGIVAAKLAQEFHRPSAVLSIINGMAHASARAVPGFNWHKALFDSRELFDRWGGHANAAGFSKQARLKNFAGAFCSLQKTKAIPARSSTPMNRTRTTSRSRSAN